MTDDVLIDTNEINKRKRVAGISALSLLGLGAFLLVTYRNYLDIGHLPLGILYALLVFLTYRSLKNAKILFSLVSIGIMGLMLFVAIAKVQWNKDYLRGLSTPQAFIMEDYIEHYPRLEEYYFVKTLNLPDWVRFTRSCVKPALNGQAVHNTCRRADVVLDTYNIDIQAETKKFMERMQQTAQSVKDGSITSGADYQACITNKTCAPIPLLPENVDAEKLQGNNTEHVEVRRAFWDLVEKKGLTPAVCQSMILCKAMVISGAISFGGSR